MFKITLLATLRREDGLVLRFPTYRRRWVLTRTKTFVPLMSWDSRLTVTRLTQVRIGGTMRQVRTIYLVL